MGFAPSHLMEKDNYIIKVDECISIVVKEWNILIILYPIHVLEVCRDIIEVDVTIAVHIPVDLVPIGICRVIRLSWEGEETDHRNSRRHTVRVNRTVGAIVIQPVHGYIEPDGACKC